MAVNIVITKKTFNIWYTVYVKLCFTVNYLQRHNYRTFTLIPPHKKLPNILSTKKFSINSLSQNTILLC